METKTASGGGGLGGGAPFELALVGKDDVFEPVEEVFGEAGLEGGAPDLAVPEDNMAMKDAELAFGGGEIARILEGLPEVVKDDPGEGEIRINLVIEGKQGAAGAAHADRVLHEAGAVSMVHGDGTGGGLEGRLEFLQGGGNRLLEGLVANFCDKFLELAPEFIKGDRSALDEVFEVMRELTFMNLLNIRNGRGEAVLVGVRIPLEPEDRTLGSIEQDLEKVGVRETNVMKDTCLVTELGHEELGIVSCFLDGGLAQDDDRLKRRLLVAGHLLEFGYGVHFPEWKENAGPGQR
jgi:hypothetical protein